MSSEQGSPDLRDRRGSAQAEPRQATQVAASAVPGGHADSPAQIPAKGWKEIARRGWAEAKVDQVPLLSAGVAFFGFLALFPALIATVLLYGLVVSPETVQRHVSRLSGALPSDARSVISDQLTTLASSESSSLNIGFVIAVLVALWSASGGVGHLINAINIAYDEEEGRGFVKRKLLGLGLTVAAILFMLVVVALVAAAPVALDNLVPSGPVRWALEAVRWILLVALFVGALAVLYRVSPDRDAPRFKWVSVGALVATALWIIASVGFSLYVNYFSSYGKTYGALAGVVVLMLWLWISTFSVLLGAEINAESEQQTIKDSTVGPRRPLGQRGAVKADSIPTRSN